MPSAAARRSTWSTRDGSHRRALVPRVSAAASRVVARRQQPRLRQRRQASGASTSLPHAGAADHRRPEPGRRKLAAVLVAGRNDDRLLALPDLLPLHRDLADRQRRHLAAPDLRHLPGPAPDVLARRHEARALARQRPRDRPRRPPDRRRRRRVHDLVAARHLRRLHRRRPLDPQPPHRHRPAPDATHRSANRLVAGRKVDRRRPAQVGRLVRARDGSQLTKLPASDIRGGAPSFSHGLVVYTHSGECGIDIAREDGTNARRLTRAC